MIVRRIVWTVIAIAVMAAAAGVVVVSASFAIYTLLRDYLGPAGAGAAIAAGFAVLLVIVGAIFLRGAKGRPAASKKSPQADISASARIFDLLRQRPVAAAGAAVAAGLIAWRNPALVSILMRAFEQRPDPDDVRRR